MMCACCGNFIHLIIAIDLCDKTFVTDSPLAYPKGDAEQEQHGDDNSVRRVVSDQVSCVHSNQPSHRTNRTDHYLLWPMNVELRLPVHPGVRKR